MKKRVLRVLLLIVCACSGLRAQETPPNAVPVTLGQSVVALNGPWKFTVGDSPIDPKTGQPQWAEPGFDDSKWETVDLTPPKCPSTQHPGGQDMFQAGQPGGIAGIGAMRGTAYECGSRSSQGKNQRSWHSGTWMMPTSSSRMED